MSYLITEIKWDTDGQEVDLPSKVLVVNGTGLLDVDEFDICNALSDHFGFCHFGFQIDEAPAKCNCNNVIDLK